MTLSEELTWRGFVNQTTFSDLKALDGDPLTFYWGVDPSADSMQIGNLAAAMMVKCFVKHGHKAVLLLGGATGLIGDPDGKSDERELKSLEEINHNKSVIAAQYRQIFGEHNFTLVDNYDWFKDLKYLDFLRDIGKHVPMRQMLSRDFVQSRLSQEGSGISYAEFSYVLIQAYDFLHLYKNYGVTLQVSGSDQWGNSIAGVELIRRLLGKEAHVYCAPLIINKATGKKFGKTEAGAIWLDSKKTSPEDFYQFWINIDDNSAVEYLRVYTELPTESVDKITEEFKRDPANRLAQKTLAFEVTKLVHGQAAAENAQLHAAKIQSGQTQSVNIKTTVPVDIVDVLLSSGLVSSKSEARQLLSAGGIYLNGRQTAQTQLTAADFVDGHLSLRRGKSLRNTVSVGLA
jgi:tyrosyl-tRNA synthetase